MVHPLAAASPFFQSFDLANHGVQLKTPLVQFAHVIEPDAAALQDFRSPPTHLVEHAGAAIADLSQLPRSKAVVLDTSPRDIARALRSVRDGRYPQRSFVLVSQPGVVDTSRAASGRQVVWAYTHVPHGSRADLTHIVTAQIEACAPGFADTIVDSHCMSVLDMQHHNPNYVGGDITGSGAGVAVRGEGTSLRFHVMNAGMPAG